MESVHEEEYKGCTIKVFPDDTPENPREMWDNFGTLICTEANYSLTDKDAPIDTLEDIEKYMKRSDVISIPLALRATGFVNSALSPTSLLFVEKEKVRQEYSVKMITPKLFEKVVGILKSEITIINHWLSGEVYGYKAFNEKGEDIDSCWGFFGYEETDWDYMIQQARDSIDHHNAQQIKVAFQEYLGI